MKNLKHKLCILNLVFFLASFTLLSFTGFSANAGNTVQDYKHLLVSPKHYSVNSNLIQLSEENETENDDDFELQALVLPFLLSQTPVIAINTPPSDYQLTVSVVNEPIYIQVHNFRV